jgi:putative ABC transport system permease protein
MIGFVLLGVSVIISFLWATFSNFSLDRSAFIKMAGMELADVVAFVTANTDANALAIEIETMEDVRKTSQLDFTALLAEGDSVIGYISNDFSRMETFNTFEGSMPRFDNEVVVPRNFAKLHGKGIGDIMRLEKGGIEEEYVITGFISIANMGGFDAVLTEEGFRKISPGYRRNSIHIYLNDGVSFDEFSEKLQSRFGIVNVTQTTPDEEHAAAKARAEEKISAYMEQYGIDSVEYAVIYNGEIIMSGGSADYRIERLTDWRAFLDTQIASLGNGSSMLLLFASVIAFIMIAVILSMTIKAILFKRRMELGVMKAGGFRTGELVKQMSLSFLPPALIGSALGSALGAILVNPAFLAVFSGVEADSPNGSGGIAVVTMAISPVAIALICVLLTAVTIGIAALSVLRIRKISAYELMSE